jgi:hypothetical protein
MTLLRRVRDLVLLWLPVVAAIAISCAVSAWSPGSQLRRDANAPVGPPRPGERRGPSADEVIERLEREQRGSAGRASLLE